MDGGRAARRAGRKAIARALLAAAFLAVASLHFIATDAEERLVPGWLPARRALVYLTGVWEIAGAVGLLIPRTRRAAAWGLAVLLVAVFPANVNHAVNNLQLGGILDSRLYQWLRLPVQPLLIWCVLWSTSPDDER